MEMRWTAGRSKGEKVGLGPALSKFQIYLWTAAVPIPSSFHHGDRVLELRKRLDACYMYYAHSIQLKLRILRCINPRICKAIEDQFVIINLKIINRHDVEKPGTVYPRKPATQPVVEVQTEARQRIPLFLLS